MTSRRNESHEMCKGEKMFGKFSRMLSAWLTLEVLQAYNNKCMN